MKDLWGTKEWFEDMLSPKHADTLGDKWGHRWRGSQKFRFTQSLEAIRPIIMHKGGRLNILDIGCAFGDFTERVLQLNPYGKIYGTDISENAIANAVVKLPRIQFKVGTLPDVEFENGFFDIVICLDVIYYLDNDKRQKSLESIHRVLKNEGYLLLSGTIDGGKRYFDIKVLNTILGNEGFKVAKTQYLYLRLYGWFESPLQWIYETIISITDVISMTEPEYKQWLGAKENRGSLTFVNGLRKIVRSLPWGSKITCSILYVLGAPCKYAIAGIRPVAISNTITRLLLGDNGATKIIILAQKSNEKRDIVSSQE